jgi:hypothetical protein
MAGRIQNEDVKSESELISAGGTKDQLINDTKIYVTADSINKTLDDAISDGDIGGGGGGGLSYTTVTTNTSMSVNTGYIINAATEIEMTLPAAAAVGDIIIIAGNKGGGGWKLIQNSGQTVIKGPNETSSGTSGTIVGSDDGSCIELVCVETNNRFIVVDSEGTSSVINAVAYLMGGNDDAGGSNTGARTEIEKMNIGAESFANSSATLDTAKYRGSSVSGSAKGYACGGKNGSGTDTNIIEDMDYQNETSAAIAATLDANKSESTGTQSSTTGYIMGGDDGGVRSDVIEDLDFTSETSAAIVETLNQAKRGATCTESSTKGYTFGGQASPTALSEIGSFVFSTETYSTIAATLNTTTGWGAGVKSDTKGYIMGGYNSGFSNVTTIEDLDFSGETSNALVATLSQDRSQTHNSGISSGAKGYCPGGAKFGPAAKLDSVEALTFSGESVATLGNTLVTAADYHQNVQS